MGRRRPGRRHPRLVWRYLDAKLLLHELDPPSRGWASIDVNEAFAGGRRAVEGMRTIVTFPPFWTSKVPAEAAR